MKVSELLQGIPCTGTYNDVEVLDVTQDSRLVEPGYLFVCIKGASFDGHAVAAEMLEKGAVAVVCDHDMGLPSQVITPNTRDAYATICANYYGNPAEKLQLIGLTGTNGKTTTTFLIKQILENAGKKVGLIGTVQNMVGSEVYPAKYTGGTRAAKAVFFDGTGRLSVLCDGGVLPSAGTGSCKGTSLCACRLQ